MMKLVSSNGIEYEAKWLVDEHSGKYHVVLFVLLPLLQSFPKLFPRFCRKVKVFRGYLVAPGKQITSMTRVELEAWYISSIEAYESRKHDKQISEAADDEYRPHGRLLSMLSAKAQGVWFTCVKMFGEALGFVLSNIFGVIFLVCFLAFVVPIIVNVFDDDKPKPEQPIVLKTSSEQYELLSISYNKDAVMTMISLRQVSTAKRIFKTFQKRCPSIGSNTIGDVRMLKLQDVKYKTTGKLEQQLPDIYEQFCKQ
jgi:hypothetical protein